MTKQHQDVVRKIVLESLMRKVEADHYPSPTMLDYIESLLTEDDLPDYVALLADRVEQDQYPSIPMLQRLLRLAA
ncbi:hypothetical protein [Jiangella rhizosphaerae]|uniref:Uncharacterized protein n=1 Tax=Jiangella rhizosphaerae TaxID=2293569 RepID=A0A418KPU1_9ACTN|nr:hypothetical protein [Jiangella rhizosphaerae]RIQ21478.1 hypothetical protein DY240_15215 [Jiangella rhizosphaerae]